LDETPPQRPRVSGFTAEENFESENLPDDEDFIPENRGYSWQQAPQKPTTGFLKSVGGEESSEEGSIFAKLKQRHRSEPQEQAPERPPATISEDEHLGLFSLDDVSLRDDTEAAAPPAASAPSVSQELPAPQAPEQPPAEIENLQDALAS